MVRLQSVELNSSVATTKDGVYIGLSTEDKAIIRSLRKINESFKFGRTHLTLVYDGSGLEIRADGRKLGYRDLVEDYKHIKIIGVDKNKENRVVNEVTVKEMIDDIDKMNKKIKRKKARDEKKKRMMVEKDVVVENVVEKPKRKRRTKKELEEARLKEKIEVEKDVVVENVAVENVTVEKPKRKRRTKKEMEEARLKKERERRNN